MDAPLSDTMDSHRLYLWAQERHKGEELAQAIGHQYFERAQALGDRAMLCACAADVGLDADEARAYLESTAGYDAVRESVQHNQRLGIRAIPVFIFHADGGFERVVHGSADVATFGRVLDDLAEHAARAAAAKEEL